MAKWADYVITAVWFTGTHISHVMLCDDNDSSISSGSKRTKAYVISLLDSGKTVVTATWDYKNAKWNLGEQVGTVTIDGERYLRTHRDSKVTDNLDNLIRGISLE